MAYACRIETDSVSPAGARITTFVITYPRFVHAELLTHRMLSRNSSSSRAIPVDKMIEAVMTDPVLPVWWGKNQSGMQAREELSTLAEHDAEGRVVGPSPRTSALNAWLHAQQDAASSARNLASIGAHKQIVNRLLEPWMWITVVVTATEWENFFRLRCHPDAQPEIREIADMMWAAREGSKPTVRHNHLPFHREDRDLDIEPGVLACVCAARCARVSYLTHDGKRDILRDIALSGELVKNGHLSPLEHVAFSTPGRRDRYANFTGWRSLRSKLDPRFVR